MQTKLATLKAAASRLDWQGALRIAAKFDQLGEQKAAIMRGHEAHANARWAVQLGRDPAADIEAGIAALCERYSLNRDGTDKASSKPYGAKNNCVRAARKALGAEAMPGEHFTVSEVAGGFTWAPIAAEAEVEPEDAEFARKAALADAIGRGEAVELPARAAAQVVSVPEQGPAVSEPPASAAAPVAVLVPAGRTMKPEVEAKRRAMLAAADAKGFGARWAGALEAARKGELPEAPDFTKPTHVSGRKRLNEAKAFVEAGDIAGLRGLVFDPEGSTGVLLYRYVRFAALALEARQDTAAAA